MCCLDGFSIPWCYLICRWLVRSRLRKVSLSLDYLYFICCITHDKSLENLNSCILTLYLCQLQKVNIIMCLYCSQKSVIRILNPVIWNFGATQSQNCLKTLSRFFATQIFFFQLLCSHYIMCLAEPQSPAFQTFSNMAHGWFLHLIPVCKSWSH